ADSDSRGETADLLVTFDVSRSADNRCAVDDVVDTYCLSDVLKGGVGNIAVRLADRREFTTAKSSDRCAQTNEVPVSQQLCSHPAVLHRRRSEFRCGDSIVDPLRDLDRVATGPAAEDQHRLHSERT